ncbi:hypothetical protein [Amycolatopsis anabasis]|uniref:hypothetical protein n=1 Tax=Amycolatopsis anabasis TaxID=1840409 RepID=UPI00131C4AF4|nr:hypothetical protein [Amycolatopsis anabasis]
MIVRGFDGWREEYHIGPTYLLDRGIAAFLPRTLGERGRGFRGLLRQPRHRAPRRDPGPLSRFTAKVRPLLGIDDPEQARSAMEDYRLTPARLALLRVPLLVLPGTSDRVFLIENARALFDGAGSPDKHWAERPDSDHRVYNHSHAKHVLGADWFTDRLHASTGVPPPSSMA